MVLRLFETQKSLQRPWAYLLRTVYGFRRIWISWTLKKRNEPEPMPEIEVQRTPFKNSIMRQQEYKQKEKWAKDQIRSRRIRYENRILKNASAVDLILDYYTLA